MSLKRRLHVNNIIAEAGTAELELDASFSPEGDFVFPTLWKFTPDGGKLLHGNTEFSLGYDTAVSDYASGPLATHFSDHLNLNMTSEIIDAGHFSLAAGPQAGFWLRSDSGARLGAVAIARMDWGPAQIHSAGLLISWTGATHPSAVNPESTLDVGTGYSRKLGSRGRAALVTPHLNLQFEQSKGAAGFGIVTEGLEFQFSRRLAVDLTGQQAGLGTGLIDQRIVAAVTLNLGRPGHWFH
jgi:hypothetical protein